ncbi:hypothetical protein GCM10010199_18730 [Dactylosporangium roseum]
MLGPPGADRREVQSDVHEQALDALAGAIKHATNPELWHSIREQERREWQARICSLRGKCYAEESGRGTTAVRTSAWNCPHGTVPPPSTVPAVIRGTIDYVTQWR